jgi:hypothetical protein
VSSSTRSGKYDYNLQMFVVEPQEINQKHLEFIRYLAERGQYDSPVLGPPEGEYATRNECRTQLEVQAESNC